MSAVLSEGSTRPSSHMTNDGVCCRVLRVGRGHRVILDGNRADRYARTLELMMGLRLATCLKAPLWVIDRGESAPDALYEMTPDGLELKVISGWRAKLLQWLMVREGHGHSRTYGSLSQYLYDRVLRQASGRAVSPGPRRQAGNKGDGKLKSAKPRKGTSVYVPPLYKRLWLDSAPRLTVPAEQAKQLEAVLATTYGVEPGARLVALRLGDGARGPSAEGTLERYQPGIEWLQVQGYTLVRVGDADCQALDLPSVIDVAATSRVAELLALYCIARADFLIADTPVGAIYGLAFGRPVLTLNASDSIGDFPIRERDLFTIQRLRDRKDGRILPLHVMLTNLDEGDLAGDAGDYELLESTPEEVLAAVKDMADISAGSVSPETAEQRAFRFLATRAGMQRSTESPWAASFGTHHSYLGRGRLAPEFARTCSG